MLASVPDYNAQQPDQSKTANGIVHFYHYVINSDDVLPLYVIVVVMGVAACCCGFFDHRESRAFVLMYNITK